MGWGRSRGQFRSDYENAQSQVVYVPIPKAQAQRQQKSRTLAPYHLCSNFDSCGGWALVRNKKTICRRPGCGAPMQPPSSATVPEITPRKDNSGKVSGSSTSKAQELLQRHLAILEIKFPGLSEHVKGVFEPDVEPTPASILHNAQSSCQIAFKDMQAAEAAVASIEAQCGKCSKQLRELIGQLNDAQIELHTARHKYDEAALAAQEQVQKNASKDSSASQVSAIIGDLGTEQLEKLSQQVADAIKAKAKPMDVDSTANDSALLAGNSTAPEGSSQSPVSGLNVVDDLAAGSLGRHPCSLPSGTTGVTVSSGGLAANGVAAHEFQKEDFPSLEDLQEGASKVQKRNASRSPRRDKSNSSRASSAGALSEKSATKPQSVAHYKALADELDGKLGQIPLGSMAPLEPVIR